MTEERTEHMVGELAETVGRGDLTPEEAKREGLEDEAPSRTEHVTTPRDSLTRTGSI